MPVKNLFIRLYGSYNEASEESGKGITNLASFIGYKHKSFSLAAEYNYQKNASYTDGQDQSGVSAYATVNLSKKSESLVVGTILLQKTNGMKRMMVWQDL